MKTSSSSSNRAIKLIATIGYVALGGGCAAAVEAEPGNVERIDSSAQAIAKVESPADIESVLHVAIDRADATLDSASHTTTFSGHGPADRSLSKDYTLNQALYGVTWGEDTDDPCYLEAFYRDVATDGAGATLTLDRCDGHQPDDMKTVTLPSNYFVTGVRVCLNSGGDKVKGIEVLGQHILCLLGASSVDVETMTCTSGNSSGHDYQVCSEASELVSCSELDASSAQEQKNCPGANNGPDSDWEATVSCDPNEVATGLKFGMTDGSGDRKMFEGIALECRALK